MPETKLRQPTHLDSLAEEEVELIQEAARNSAAGAPPISKRTAEKLSGAIERGTALIV
jgi:hypothetical protein